MKFQKIKNPLIIYLMESPYANILKTCDNKYYIEYEKNNWQRIRKDLGKKLEKKAIGTYGPLEKNEKLKIGE